MNSLCSFTTLTTTNKNRYINANSYVIGKRRNDRMIILGATAEDDDTDDDTDDEKSDDSSGGGGGGTDILNSPAFLKRKLEVIKSDIAKVDEEIENAKNAVEEGKAVWGEKLASIQTERANLQERMSKQTQEVGGDATVEVAQKLLNVLDNFDRAFASVTPEIDADKEAEAAYKKAYDGILETLKTLGVKEVETVGKEFDYELHNAVMMRPSDEYDEGIVMEELAKGYAYGEVGQDEEGNKLDGQLIRAAMVIVAA